MTMTLPRLHQTLLSDILSELPEETAQLQDAVLAIATKYRADLHAQLDETQRFQEHVTRTHEKVHRRLKRTARSIEDTGRRAKVDGSQPGKALCDEVVVLSQDVMGKLMGIVELLGDSGANVDGDKYPLLKKVLGQEGFEVVEIPSDLLSSDNVDTVSESEVGYEESSTSTDKDDAGTDSDNHENPYNEMDDIATLNQGSRELQPLSIAPSQSIESSDPDQGPSTEDPSDCHSDEELTHEEDTIQSQDDAEVDEQVIEVTTTENEGREETNVCDAKTLKEGLSPLENEHNSTELPNSITNTPQEVTPTPTNAAIAETEDPLSNDHTPTHSQEGHTTSSLPDSQNEDELTSIESTIAKYKAKKFRSFPMPIAPSITSLSSSISTTSTTSVQGVTYSPSIRSSTSLNESLKKFI